MFAHPRTGQAPNFIQNPLSKATLPTSTRPCTAETGLAIARMLLLSSCMPRLGIAIHILLHFLLAVVLVAFSPLHASLQLRGLMLFAAFALSDALHLFVFAAAAALLSFSAEGEPPLQDLR